jgi:addiction module RelE/StbE family toxin
MPKSLTWRPDARRRYFEILDYIAERNLAASERLQTSIESQIRLLLSFPNMGRPGREKRTRELVVHPNYIIIYDVRPTEIRILRVLHAHQKYP